MAETLGPCEIILTTAFEELPGIGERLINYFGIYSEFFLKRIPFKKSAHLIQERKALLHKKLHTKGLGGNGMRELWRHYTYSGSTIGSLSMKKARLHLQGSAGNREEDGEAGNGGCPGSSCSSCCSSCFCSCFSCSSFCALLHAFVAVVVGIVLAVHEFSLIVMCFEVLNCASKTTLELFRGAVVVAFGAGTVCFLNALWLGERGWVLATCCDAVRCVAVVTALLMRCVLVWLSCISNQLCKKSADVLRVIVVGVDGIVGVVGGVLTKL